MKKKFEWRHVNPHMRDDDWQEVEALDEWMAAKGAADQYDSEDRYMIRSGGAEVFEVRPIDTDKVTRWSVWGEARPYYYAQSLAPAGMEPQSSTAVAPGEN